jgi:hypothetical protein
MKNLILVFFLLFSGCALKQAFNKDKLYNKVLSYTKRAQVLASLETKALIDAVYLNPLYKDKFKNPTFLIGVYNSFNNTLNNEEFQIYLNGQKPLRVSKKIPKYILYKEFPFYNSWMSYYIVEFPKTAKPYVIEYKSKHWGEAKLSF